MKTLMGKEECFLENDDVGKRREKRTEISSTEKVIGSLFSLVGHNVDSYFLYFLHIITTPPNLSLFINTCFHCDKT